jgi:FKBP-type peptidyl-prolyl cis-trans isomerase FklB
MKGFVASLSLLLILVACQNSDTAKGEVLPLETRKQEISYIVGADHARQITRDSNFDKYNKQAILKGFDEGLAHPESYDRQCEAEIQSLFGQDAQGFNEAHNDEASLCIGKLLGSVFKNGWEKANSLSEFDLKYVRYGFRLALEKGDTLIETSQRDRMLQEFMTKVNTKMKIAVEQRELKYFDEIKTTPGILALPQGIYLQTIKAGNGGSPTIAEDVKAHYVLMSTEGDTIQSSLGGPTIPVFNLSSVIPGWTVGIPYMKKGGKYKLYVPQGMAYGASPPSADIPPFATLVFYVELIDYGKAGTMK